MTEINHITKHTHESGRLIPPRAWCGAPIMGWNFLGAQHAALSIDADDYASWYVCLDCVDKITEALAKADSQRGVNAVGRSNPTTSIEGAGHLAWTIHGIVTGFTDGDIDADFLAEARDAMAELTRLLNRMEATTNAD